MTSFINRWRVGTEIVVLCWLLGFTAWGTPVARAGSRAAMMVSVEAMSADADAVVLTYSVPVTPARIREDVAAIQHETGWAIANLQISSILDPMSPESGLLYSAQFLSSGRTQQSDGRLPVAPLVTALREYGNLIILFDLDGPFQYSGPGEYEDGNVAIEMYSRSLGSCTYAFKVAIKDPRFSRLDTPDSLTAPTPPGPSPWNRLAIAIVVAAIVGWSSYLLLIRVMLRAKSCGAVREPLF